MQGSPITEGEAQKLGNRIFEMDHSIYALTVVDGVGRLIWQAISKSMPQNAYRQEPSESAIRNYTSQLAVLSSMFKLAEDSLGKSKFIISVYEKLNFIIFPMSDRNAAMISLVSSDADAMAIAQKIYKLI